MTCERFRNDLLLRDSGELPPARMRDLEAHLARCADCREYQLGTARTLRAAATSLRSGEPSPWTMTRIRTAARTSTPGWRVWVSYHPAVTALAAAALLLVLVGGLWLWPRGTREIGVDELHAMVTILAENDGLQVVALSEADSEAVARRPDGDDRDAALRHLAKRLLIMEGLAVDDDDFTTTPEVEPGTTDLRWRNTRAPSGPVYG